MISVQILFSSVISAKTFFSIFSYIRCANYCYFAWFDCAIFAASVRTERAATLIVTGFLWSMWLSRLGHYYYSQAISDLEIRPGWWAGWLWMIL